MKVVWSDWALDRLDEIHTYLEQEANERIADRTVVKVLEAIALLAQYPYGGQVEPWLEHKALGIGVLLSATTRSSTGSRRTRSASRMCSMRDRTRGR